MKPNSVFFPLTNPSERLDKGRSLAASESACRNPKTTAVLALIRRSSGGCRVVGRSQSSDCKVIVKNILFGSTFPELMGSRADMMFMERERLFDAMFAHHLEAEFRRSCARVWAGF